jgi:hypothetical protein
LTPLTLLLSAASACHVSWILSAACPLVPALFMLLCVLFLSAMSCWLGLLLLTRLCLLEPAHLRLTWCAACGLPPCHPFPMLPSVAPPPSAPRWVLGPNPSWSKAWSPICIFSAARGLKKAYRGEKASSFLFPSFWKVNRGLPRPPIPMVRYHSNS